MARAMRVLAYSLLASAATVLALPPVRYIPLNYLYKENTRLTTTLTTPYDNSHVEVVYDFGSASFFLFGPGSIIYYGCIYPSCRTVCNASIPYIDNWQHDPTADGMVNETFDATYGGGYKEVFGRFNINQTFEYSNSASVGSTRHDVQVAIAATLTIKEAGSGIPVDQCPNTPPPEYDQAIMGVGPCKKYPSDQSGPCARQNAIDLGVSPTHSLWFDRLPEDNMANRTGGALWGGIDTSKYTGPLVKVPWVEQTSPTGGYWVGRPKISVQNHTFPEFTDFNFSCFIDSGAANDNLPINKADASAFLNATGLVIAPSGSVAWPGDCDSLPDTTIDLEFAGTEPNTSFLLEMPLKTWVRQDSVDPGYCQLNLAIGDCAISAPMCSALFFAADDERHEIAFAKGGVSEVGSSYDPSSVIDRIP